MAEEEERILIGTDIESPCVKCKVELCAEKCEEYEKFAEEFKPGALKVFARQEVIERIAKEIARNYDPRKPNKEEYEIVWEKELFPATKKYYLDQAESVLNALLEKGE